MVTNHYSKPIVMCIRALSLPRHCLLLTLGLLAGFNRVTVY